MNDQEYIKFVNRTYSHNFSKNQVLPKFIIDFIEENNKYKYNDVLDFGAGKDIYGTMILRDSKMFRNVVAYDIGNNFVDGVHDKYALLKRYDIVMMSNVMNVQPSARHVEDLIEISYKCLKPIGILFCNLPLEPVKCDHIDAEYLTEILSERYMVDDIQYNYRGNIFVCYKEDYRGIL